MKPETFFDKLKANPRPVIIDFWAPWSAHCRVICLSRIQDMQKLAGDWQ